MKTYPMPVMREAFLSIVDKDVYVRFSVYIPKGKPVKVKAKILNMFGDKRGLRISFRDVYWNRKRFFQICVSVKDIRWITIPFDKDRLAQMCSQFVKKLEAPKDVSSNTLPETAQHIAK